MCNFFSGLGLRDGSIRWDALIDSHSDLFTLFQIPDTTTAHVVKFELQPPRDDAQLFDIAAWTFKLDEDAAPVWWEDVAAKIEEQARNTVRRMFVIDRTVPLLTNGCWIVGNGGTIHRLLGGRIWRMSGGTLTEMSGGTLTAMRGGTLTAMWGGTLTAMRGGTVVKDYTK